MEKSLLNIEASFLLANNKGNGRFYAHYQGEEDSPWSYKDMNPWAIIMTDLAKYASWYNNGMNVLKVIYNFLIIPKAHSII